MTNGVRPTYTDTTLFDLTDGEALKDCRHQLRRALDLPKGARDVGLALWAQAWGEAACDALETLQDEAEGWRDGAAMSSETMRAIDASEFKAPEPPKAGAAPMLQWIAIADLVVDDRYQRPIYGAGRANVQGIAAGFRWAKFAPLIVAPVAGGKFAVIDGQHRATAAKLIGIESVPAQVVIADETEQAAAFKAINGQVTRIHKLALQHAALAAGDPAAAELRDVAAAAGVTILRYPKSADRIEPGETMALSTLAEALRAYGRETVITALTCVTETDNNRGGVLAAATIRALCAVVGGNAGWRDAGEALLRAFDDIDLEGELDEAKITRRPKGVATWEVLADRLRTTLQGVMPKAPSHE